MRRKVVASYCCPVRVVVVGGGLGGARVVEELRRAGFDGSLTLVGSESSAPYDRPPLSKAVLQTGGPPPLLVEDWGPLDVELRLGRAATGLDTASRQVELDDGTHVAYDVAVLAPGAEPHRLPGPRLDGVHVLRTDTDAAALRADLLEHRSLTVVGGGFLGCEAAASARVLDVEVDLVERLAGPLVRVIGPVLAARMASLHTGHDVRLHGGVGVAALHGDDAVEAVELDDGRVLAARVVLVALGVRPTTSWLAGSLELATDSGIVCDELGRTSAPDVWALGDAAAWGDRPRVEHWTSAVEQAAAVAASVLGTPTPDTSVPYIWSDQHGSTLQCVGAVGPDTETEVLEVGDGLAALHTDGDRLLGAVLLDARKLAGRVRRVLAATGTVDEARAALHR